MLKKLFVIVALLLSVSVFAADKQPVFTGTKKPIIVSQSHRQFAIVLKSNPSTGFSWTVVKHDHFLISLKGHKYVAPKNKKLMGAPGYDVWTFEAVKAQYRVNQVGHIVMQYKRPWTKKGATTKTFMVIVKKH